MKKAELIKSLAEKLGTTQVEADKTLDIVVGVVFGALKEGKEIPTTYGAFKPTATKDRDMKLPGGLVKAVKGAKGARFQLGTAGKKYLNS